MTVSAELAGASESAAGAKAAQAAAAKRSRLAAIGLMCLAVFWFAGLDTCAKYLVTWGGYPPQQIVFARYASNAAILLLFVNPWTMPTAFRSARPLAQILRGALLVCSTFLNFVALRYLQLAETSAIMFATPFITAVLAGLFLGQWLGPRRWVAIFGGTIGVLVVTRPGLEGLHWAAGLSILGACCYAVYNLMTRGLAGHDSTVTTLTFGSLVGTLVALPFALAMGDLLWPRSLLDLALMVAIGAFGLVGHWCLILAHRRASAQDLGPFMYTQLVWMTLLGFLVFGDVPGSATLIGAGIVIASGLYLLLLERKGAA